MITTGLMLDLAPWSAPPPPPQIIPSVDCVFGELGFWRVSCKADPDLGVQSQGRQEGLY